MIANYDRLTSPEKLSLPSTSYNRVRRALLMDDPAAGATPSALLTECTEPSCHSEDPSTPTMPE